MLDREEIVREALTLSADDREYVADALERSLHASEEIPPEIAAAWSREIDRRLTDYDRGETAARDAEASDARLREALAAHRAAKIR